jgi:quercetin dioxygenase-like cupin family protein
MSIKVLNVNKDFVRIPFIPGGDARIVIWPGMGAKYASYHYFIMKPGQETIAHAHEKSEDFIYIIQGRGEVVDVDKGTAYPFEPGCIIYIEPKVTHILRCNKDSPDDYIAVGGPCPPDPELYRAAGKRLLKEAEKLANV